MPRPTRALIDLDALGRNLESLVGRVSPETAVLACVKADAYGHGVALVAPALDGAGVDAFGVASAEEGDQLRRLGIVKPVLALGQLDADELGLATRANLDVTVSSHEMLGPLQQASMQAGVVTAVHLKVDTGMGRLGVRPEGADRLARRIVEHDHLRLAAVMTHFPDAECDPAFCRCQIEQLNHLVDRLRAAGIDVPVRHAANSASIAQGIGTELEMVRPGIALYGCWPSPACPHPVELAGVMTLVSRVVLIKEMPVGATVGYGRTFTTARPSHIAVVPIGYGDGYPRCLGGRAVMQVRGVDCPVVGRVSMDQLSLDVTDVPGAAVGDEAIAYNPDPAAANSLEALAGLADTIPYELTCRLTRRVPRVEA